MADNTAKTKTIDESLKHVGAWDRGQASSSPAGGTNHTADMTKVACTGPALRYAEEVPITDRELTYTIEKLSPSNTGSKRIPQGGRGILLIVEKQWQITTKNLKESRQMMGSR